ncbi:MAG: hypothetical protein LBF95_00735, partial [Treponema sp.]|nr:hypothetical protein [Treponema sp.]
LLAGAFFLIVVSGHDGGYRGYKGRLNKQRKLIWGAAGRGGHLTEAVRHKTGLRPGYMAQGERGRCRPAAPRRVAVGGNQQIVISK